MVYKRCIYFYVCESLLFFIFIAFYVVIFLDCHGRIGQDRKQTGDILNQDVKEKRAQYIQRDNELMQEFPFAHSSTKCNINAIFNSHFTGSVLWDLFGREAEMIYNTWNISIRRMFCLDQRSHRYFIEPVRQNKAYKNSFYEKIY